MIHVKRPPDSLAFRPNRGVPFFPLTSPFDSGHPLALAFSKAEQPRYFSESLVPPSRPRYEALLVREGFIAVVSLIVMGVSSRQRIRP